MALTLIDLKNYVLGRTHCEHRAAVGQTITRHFTRMGHTYRNDPKIAAEIDGFIRAMSTEDLKKWTTQLHKQSHNPIRDPELDFLLSEPVTLVTNAHLAMTHLPLLSPDADLLEALLRRNQFLEEQNVWLQEQNVWLSLSAPENAGPQSAVQVPVPAGMEVPHDVPVVQVQQAVQVEAATPMEMDGLSDALFDWEGLLHSDLPL